MRESEMAKPTVEDLRTQVRAPIITASDRGYDEARAVHNDDLRKVDNKWETDNPAGDSR
jgi:hypothetical protein